jgi:hypothetical protein
LPSLATSVLPRRDHLTSKKTSKPPAIFPSVPKRTFNPREVGFTLASDEQTLKEIEEIRETAVKAAQKILKFAWR